MIFSKNIKENLKNMDNKMIAKETKQNEVKHTRTFLIVGVSLIVIGIVMLVIKGMSPEYIDAEGILHERFGWA